MLARLFAALAFAAACALPALAYEISAIAVGELPAEAHQTLRLIDAGGPFPHRRDGVVFGNYERILPKRPRGYYREYTVVTPGRRDRGARRIVTGGSPPSAFYYTADHYQSFRRIQR